MEIRTCVGGCTLWLFAQFGFRSFVYHVQNRSFGLQIPFKRNGSVRSLGFWQFWWLVSAYGRGVNVGPKATSALDLGEADGNDPGSDSGSFFPGTALRSSRRGSHIREVGLVARQGGFLESDGNPSISPPSRFWRSGFPIGLEVLRDQAPW